MPGLWDTNPDNVFGTPGEEPDPALQRPRRPHTEEVRLKDPTATSGSPPMP
jgi:hypothetical protein